MSQNNKADPKLFLWDYFKFKFGNCSTKYYLVNLKKVLGWEDPLLLFLGLTLHGPEPQKTEKTFINMINDDLSSPRSANSSTKSYSYLLLTLTQLTR